MIMNTREEIIYGPVSRLIPPAASPTYFLIVLRLDDNSNANCEIDEDDQRSFGDIGCSFDMCVEFLP